MRMMNETNMNKSHTPHYLAQSYREDPRNCSNVIIDQNIQVHNREELSPHFISDMTSIYIVTEGYGKIYLNQKTVELKKNSLIQIPQNTLVTVIEQDSKIILSGVQFSPNFISEIRVPSNVLGVFNHFSYNSLSVINLERKEAKLIKHEIVKLKEYRDTCRTHLFRKELLINSFQKFLMKTGGLIQQYTEVMDFNHSPQECLYIKFNDLVQNQFKEERIIKKYADQLHVTPKYLGEVVKEYSGKHASKIIKDMVILEAKFLLSDPELNISQIAEKLNFNDVSIFGKYFKNETGYHLNSIKQRISCGSKLSAPQLLLLARSQWVGN